MANLRAAKTCKHGIKPKKDCKTCTRESSVERQRLYIKRHPEKAAEKRTGSTKRWDGLLWSAKDRGLCVELTKEQWENLVLGSNCHYCGASLAHSCGSALDRKDSSKGYLIDNVVPCCGSCNSIRGKDLISYEEMVYIMPILLKFRSEKEES